jgi:hypothetical protein
MGGGRHIICLYEAGYELGENFSGLERFSNEQKYIFWLTGIERHLAHAIE